jgi:hypothetical protein
MLLKALPAPDIKSAVPSGAVEPAILASWGLKPGSQLLIEYNERAVAVWMHADHRVPKEQKDKPVIWLTKRARTALGIGDSGSNVVNATIPETVQLTAAVALVDDLPKSYEVDVSATVKRRITKGGRWGLLNYDEVPMPVRLRQRKIDSNKIRISFPTRALIYPASDLGGEILQLSSVLEDRLPFLVRLTIRHPYVGILGLVVGLSKRLTHHVGQLFESILRPILLAPVVVTRTTEALIGEDTYQVVRINAQIFPLIGIKPGDQVIVSWASRQVVATALEFLEINSDPKVSTTLQRTDLHHTGTRSSIAPHLAIGITAPMRASLGIPRHTVVNVRRRLTPLILGRINELTIPVGGLLLAALALPGVIPRWGIGVSIIIVIALALISARYRLPPTGRWP